MKLVWSRRAKRQLEEAVSTIAEDDPLAAWRVYDRITEKAQKLRDFPELGPAIQVAGLRQLTITGTPYVLVYRVTKAAIEIAFVWHSRQNRPR